MYTIVRRIDVSSGVGHERDSAEELDEVADTGNSEDDDVSLTSESAGDAGV
jgi:hypothetical protein